MRAVRVGVVLPAAVLAAYFVLLASETGFDCRHGAYIGMGALGVLFAAPLTGLTAAVAAAVSAKRARVRWAVGALPAGALVALAAITLVWELTPLDGCYT